MNEEYTEFEFDALVCAVVQLHKQDQVIQVMISGFEKRQRELEAEVNEHKKTIGILGHNLKVLYQKVIVNPDYEHSVDLPEELAVIRRCLFTFELMVRDRFGDEHGW